MPSLCYLQDNNGSGPLQEILYSGTIVQNWLSTGSILTAATIPLSLNTGYFLDVIIMANRTDNFATNPDAAAKFWAITCYNASGLAVIKTATLVRTEGTGFLGGTVSAVGTNIFISVQTTPGQTWNVLSRVKYQLTA